MLEEVKISYSKATVILLLDGWWSISGGYFQIVRKWFTKDHTKLSILTAADGGGDDTRENDDGTCCYCQTAKDGSMNYVLYIGYTCHARGWKVTNNK